MFILLPIQLVLMGIQWCRAPMLPVLMRAQLAKLSSRRTVDEWIAELDRALHQPPQLHVFDLKSVEDIQRGLSLTLRCPHSVQFVVFTSMDYFVVLFHASNEVQDDDRATSSCFEVIFLLQVESIDLRGIHLGLSHPPACEPHALSSVVACRSSCSCSDQ